MALIGLKGGGVAGQESTAISTSAQHTLGTIALDSSGGEYIYCRGSTAVSTMAAGDWVSYQSTAGEFTMARIPTSTVFSSARLNIGISMSTISATTSFGWVQIFGKSTIARFDSTAQDGHAQLHLSSIAAGALTTSTGGAPVWGANTLSSGNSSNGAAWLQYPFLSTVAGA